MKLEYNEETKIGKIIIRNDIIHQRISDVMHTEYKLKRRISKLKKEVMSMPYESLKSEFPDMFPKICSETLPLDTKKG
ncbi:MAG: hypothetical protein EBQ92_08155 [Proteobacteria bacterium]|nr:hypothetical protein [Pseudomonadota bacterium]